MVIEAAGYSETPVKVHMQQDSSTHHQYRKNDRKGMDVAKASCLQSLTRNTTPDSTTSPTE
jgi:hypothetical protein